MNITITEVLEICRISVILLIPLIFVIALNIYVNKYNKNQKYIAEINLDLDKEGSETIILEKMIQDCFDNYIILNLEYIKDVYITQDQQRDMLRDISTDIMNRLSPILINKLSLIYSAAAIPDLITEKVNLLIISYAIEKNKNSN